MEEQEIRLGNYIQYRDKSSLLTVESLGSNGFSTINQDGIQYGSDDITEYNGIPLTEEWLLKFGFVDFEKESFSYYIENNGEIVFKKSGLDILYDYPIQYVHQLQNLFFSLCGEELSVIN